MKIIDFDNTPKPDWDNVSANSSETWFFHYHDWVKIESGFFTEKNFSFSIYDDHNKCIGICPLYQRKSQRGWSENIVDSGHHRYTGPAFLDDIPPGDRKAAIKICMSRIFDVALSVDADRITLNAHNMAPANTKNRTAEIPFWIRDYQFISGLGMGEAGDISFPGYSTLSADQIVVLDKSEEELFSNLDDDFRKAVRKAIKSGMRIKEDIQNPVQEYYKLAVESAKRTGETLNPIAYYENLWNAFALSGKAKILFVVIEENPIAAILLIVEKGTVNFFGGVSNPDFLNLRVNNFMHWEAVSWAKRNGFEYYRLGPIFPELPKAWPLSKVSKFKGDMGGISLSAIQGCKFLKPEKYLDNAKDWVEILCSRPFNSMDNSGMKLHSNSEEFCRVFGIAFGDKLDSLFKNFPGNTPPVQEYEISGKKMDILIKEGPKRFLRKRKSQTYRTLFDCMLFKENTAGSFWSDNSKKYSAGLTLKNGDRASSLYLGIDFQKEILAYRQGSPEKVNSTKIKNRFEFEFERPMYLFDDNVDKSNPTIPWADRLGFGIAEKLSQISGLPLLEPLPGGLKGLFIITGDDDQAELYNYEAQIKELNGMPMTYFLHHMTKHNSESLASMPENIELAFHPDAVDAPSDYPKLFAEQIEKVRALTDAAGKKMQPFVRNHGFLNDGYWGHLKIWEEHGIKLSSNLPGVNGTALNGSFLPMKLYRPDNTWSDHYSILTAFGDGMIFALKMTENASIKQIRKLVAQIESENPGVLVFNLHPQNIRVTRKIHREMLYLSKRGGWKAMKLGDYFEWIKMRDTITLSVVDRKLQLKSHFAGEIEDIVLKFPAKDGSWIRVPVPAWMKNTEVDFPE